MPAILSDHDIEGHVRVLLAVWTSADWLPLWESLGYAVESLKSLGLGDNVPDSLIWTLCQERGIILITGNRNAEGEDSLEGTMRRLCRPDSLPVITLANPNRVMVDRQYAEHVAVQILDVLMDLDRLRGTRRLFVP
jgi:hypothetical protein